MCSAVYTFFVFEDDIGNNDPRLYSVQVRTPPDLVGAPGGPTDAFEYLAHLFRPAPPPGRASLSAARFEEHVYGNFDRDFVANRAWATAYILMPRG